MMNTCDRDHPQIAFISNSREVGAECPLCVVQAAMSDFTLKVEKIYTHGAEIETQMALLRGEIQELQKETKG